MSEHDLNEEALEQLFVVARAAAPQPSVALMARILADAETEMPGAASLATGRSVSPEAGGRIAAILSTIGGWGGLGGLVTAAMAGLWIGASGLADPLAMTSDLLGTTPLSVELIPNSDGFDVAAGTEW